VTRRSADRVNAPKRRKSGDMTGWCPVRSPDDTQFPRAVFPYSVRGKARQASDNDLAGDRGFHNTWSRGSPFQMPARLAVGLDLGSGRQRRSPVLLRPVFANSSRRVWVPRAAVLEFSDLGCTEDRC
jgi:hypothetical protein